MIACGNVYVDKTFKTFMLKCIYCLKDINIQDFKDFIQHVKYFHGTNDEPFIDPFDETMKEQISVEEIKSDLDLTIEKSDVKHNTKEVRNKTNKSDESDEDSCKNEVESCLHSDSNIDSDCDSNSDGSQNTSIISTEDEPKCRSKLNISLYCRNKSTKYFIEACKGHPCLWHPQDNNYKDKKSLSNALKNIKDEMKQKTQVTMTVSAIKNALKKIISQYRNVLNANQNYLNDNHTNASISKEYMDMCTYLSALQNDEQIDKFLEKNSSRGILHFGKVNKTTLAFIETFQLFPSLYDTQHEDYTNQQQRKITYEKMSQILKNQHSIEMTYEQLQRSTRSLRIWYYKICNYIKKNSSQLVTLPKSHEFYVQKCNFLPTRPSKNKMPCEECGKMFFTATTLKTHLYKMHKKGELPYKCPNCERSFEQKSTFVTHQQRHHIGKTFQCEHCERRFAVLIDLQRHTRTHTDQKPFVCELCGKAFRFKTHLGYHVTAIHTKIRAYKCTMCPKDFLKPVHLRDHIKAHLDIRDKICETCGKGFTNCHSLIRHRQIHSEVKKFACKLCDAKFHQFVGLNSHMKRTHNVVKNKSSI